MAFEATKWEDTNVQAPSHRNSYSQSLKRTWPAPNRSRPACWLQEYRDRLDELYAGNIESASGLIERLPVAVDLPKTNIEQAIEESRRHIAEAKGAAWRAAFQPHAVILTDRKRPEPLFVAAIIGIDQLKRVDFEPGSSPLTFIDQGLKGLRKKLERWKGQIPCFGKPTGIIINYRPYKAVRFNLDG